MTPLPTLDHLRYVAVEGPIGVGKTTLTRLLAERLKGRQLNEVVEENPFLKAFYSDRAKYAFQTQLFFLLSRFKQQQELFQDDLFQQALVSDYMFAKDRVFATLTLDPNELGLYDRVYDHLSPRIRKPDLVIYLRARLDVLLARIKKRGREFERRFDAEYLDALCRVYNDFFFHYSDTPLLVVDTSELNFVESEADFEEFLAAAAGARQNRELRAKNVLILSLVSRRRTESVRTKVQSSSYARSLWRNMTSSRSPFCIIQSLPLVCMMASALRGVSSISAISPK
jgi:deoxyguanosine kinase